MQATEHNFSSTQRFRAPTVERSTLGEEALSTEARRIQQRLIQAPTTRRQLWTRLMQMRLSVALLASTIAGLVLALSQADSFSWAQQGVTISLLLLGNTLTILGTNLLHELHDYRRACQTPDTQRNQTIFATGYHLLAAEFVYPTPVQWTGYSLLFGGFICYMGLLVQVGWPLLFFYVGSLLLLYTYSAHPVRFGYRGRALGEIGLFLGYGALPLLGSYYTVSHHLTRNALLVTIPFGLAAILLFGNYNFIHHRRDWLMHKRTSVVVLGHKRVLSLHAIVTLSIYVAFLCIVSLTYLPMIALVTLGALPLNMRVYSRLYGTEIGLEESFLLYRATITGMIWTTFLFCLALLINHFFG